MAYMIIILCFLVSTALVLSEETSQKFLYKAEDAITIEPNSTITLTLELSTAAHEYLGESSVYATLDIQRSNSTVIPYDIYYFSYWSQQGQECYKDWMMTGNIPVTIPCSYLVDIDYSLLPTCAQYTNCDDEMINITIPIVDQLFLYSYVMLQNNAMEKVDLATSLRIELSSDNGWFYWGVGLTCFLLISLVIFAGIVFYWMLKYKKVKKMFEQFKLTEQHVIKED